MKKLFFAFALSFFCVTSAVAQDAKRILKDKLTPEKNITKIAEEKNPDDIKTFDFDRILREANDYFVAANSWKTLKCIPKSAFLCTKHECPKIELPKVAAMVIDKETETMAICRNKNCQYHAVTIEHAGVFVNVRVKNSDSIAVRILGNSRFKEMAIIGLDTYITNGTCEVLE